jgi:acetoin utilization deacetylase AcuC-like enzyme
VAVLDIDYHHGNGTQSIFYHRNDVVTASIHGNPKTVFPYFSGHAHECGRDDGLGHNLNQPLADGTIGSEWLVALETVLEWINEKKTFSFGRRIGIRYG